MLSEYRGILIPLSVLMLIVIAGVILVGTCGEVTPLSDLNTHPDSFIGKRVRVSGTVIGNYTVWIEHRQVRVVDGRVTVVEFSVQKILYILSDGEWTILIDRSVNGSVRGIWRMVYTRELGVTFYLEVGG